MRALAWLLAAAAPAAWAQPQRWDFDVTLDGKPIGTHSFVLERGAGDARTLRSDAAFEVRLLGVRVYRYRHHATEQWAGDCLQSLQSRTDDNGEDVSVDQRAGQGLPPGCAMSFAYWNRAILDRRELLNAQTGQVEPVRIERLGARAEVPAAAQRWRIHALKQRIDLGYDGQGRWVTLDATLEKGRVLSYRLRDAGAQP